MLTVVEKQQLLDLENIDSKERKFNPKWKTNRMVRGKYVRILGLININ